MKSLLAELNMRYFNSANGFNKTWVDKQGDFFTDSAVILLAAIIWYLKIYDRGRYCTFPHAIEFLCQPLDKIFPILSSYPELENYLSPFMDAWKSNVQDQLQGQVASVKIPLSRMISPQLYWVLTGNDFTLDINNPEEPKILCMATTPTGRASTARRWDSIIRALSGLSIKRGN